MGYEISFKVSSVAEQHPQFALKQFLAALSITRDEVASLTSWGTRGRDWLVSEIMRPPDVAIDELQLRGMVDQVAQQQPALRHLPVDDMGGVRGEIECAAAGARDRAHHRRTDV